MKVGILTAHCSTNPGASLQTHALYQKLVRLGQEPVIIDYRPEYFTDLMDEEKRAKERFGRDWIKVRLLRRRLQKKHDLFLAFEQQYYPQKTRRYSTAEQINQQRPKFDCYLCGSDQIWNPSHIHYDNTFTLGFTGKGGDVKRISYASSIGQDVLSEKDMNFLRTQVKKLDSVSVREDTAVKVLAGLNIEAQQHIDPVMLFDAAYWRGIMTRPERVIPERYIFFYPLERKPIETQIMKELKAKTGLKCVAADSALRKTSGVDIQIDAYSPTDFLWLLDHAQYVITNSFHGMAFSLLFQKKLISFKCTTRNSRIESLCRLLGLEGIQVETLEHFRRQDWHSIWNSFGSIQGVLDKERDRADSYLRSKLNDSVEN